MFEHFCNEHVFKYLQLTSSQHKSCRVFDLFLLCNNKRVNKLETIVKLQY